MTLSDMALARAGNLARQDDVLLTDATKANATGVPNPPNGNPGYEKQKVARH